MGYLFDDYVLDTARRELRRGPALVSVEPQVFDLLVHLIRNRDRVVSKDDLIGSVWQGRIISESTLFNRINAARTAIGDRGDQQRLIKTLPRKGFRFVGSVREDVAAPSGGVSPAVADRPSIAVLPFTNLNSDPGRDYLCDGITGDIITELSRFSELMVISRNSSFTFKGRAADVRVVGRELGVRYVVEGTIGLADDRVRITAQLVETGTGAHRWAERFERKLDDVFAVQDEVARTIVAIIAVHLGKAEAARTAMKPPATWHAYDFYLQGAEAYSAYMLSYAPAALYTARRHLTQSLSLDPDYARAFGTLSRTYLSAWINPIDGDHLQPATLDHAWQLALRSVQLDANLPQAHANLGYVLTYRREHDESLAAFARGFALNPSFTEWTFALAQVYAGDPRRAIETIGAHTKLDPFYPPAAMGFLGFAHYMLEQYDLALPPLRECVRRAPNFRGGHFWLAATYAQLARLNEARAEATEVLRIEPGYTITRSARPLAAFRHDRQADHWLQGLRKAGLPE